MGFTQKDLPPEVWKAIMERGVPVGEPARIKEKPTSKAPKPLIGPGVEIEGRKLVIRLPIVTKSESNERSWCKTMSRKISAKKTVRETIGRHHAKFTRFVEEYHKGAALNVLFKRVGHSKCDHSNLASAMKYIEDSVAAFLAADDGDPRWRSSFTQLPDFPLVGVVVEIEVFS